MHAVSSQEQNQVGVRGDLNFILLGHPSLVWRIMVAWGGKKLPQCSREAEPWAWLLKRVPGHLSLSATGRVEW